MKLTSVVMHSSTSEDVAFHMREGMPFSRYMIRTIIGIDAEELIPKFYAVGKRTDERYHEYTMRPRDVVIRVALNPQFHINETVDDIRDELYRLISSNRTGKVQLQFKSGPTVVAVLNGMITKFEVAHFNMLPELQVTVNCVDPILRSIHPIDWDVAELATTNPVELPDGASTSPHGLQMRVVFTAIASTFKIEEAATNEDWAFEVTPTGGFLVDDELYISSEFNNKQVYIFRPPSTTIYLMDKIVSGSIWPQIFPGNNVLYFDQIASFDWMEVKYYSAYWGV